MRTCAKSAGRIYLIERMALNIVWVAPTKNITKDHDPIQTRIIKKEKKLDLLEGNVKTVENPLRDHMEMLCIAKSAVKKPFTVEKVIIQR